MSIDFVFLVYLHHTQLLPTLLVWLKRCSFFRSRWKRSAEMYGTLDFGLMFFLGMVSVMIVVKTSYLSNQKEFMSSVEYMAVGRH